MNRDARVQTGAGLTTVAALPLLYLGGIQEIAVLTGIGFVIFTLGMLAVPLIRYLPTGEHRVTVDGARAEDPPPRPGRQDPASTGTNPHCDRPST